MIWTPLRTALPVLTLLALGACNSAPKGPVTETGELATGDLTLTGGEFQDSYSVQAKEGQWIKVNLTSVDFDPYLILRTPDGEQSENDDAADGDTHRAQVVYQVKKSGQFSIIATTYESGEKGAYTLIYEVTDTEPATSESSTDSTTAATPTSTPTSTSADGLVSQTGELEAGDLTLTAGEFQDTYSVTARQGQWIKVNLTSTDFDPYLILRTPGAEQSENDDATDGDTEHSEVIYHADESGEFRIVATTYQARATGTYKLTYQVTDTEPSPAAPSSGAADESAGVNV